MSICQTDFVQPRSDIYFVYLIPNEEIIKIQIGQIQSVFKRFNGNRLDPNEIQTSVRIIQDDIQTYQIYQEVQPELQPKRVVQKFQSDLEKLEKLLEALKKYLVLKCI